MGLRSSDRSWSGEDLRKMAQDPAMSAPQAAGAQTAPLVLGAPQSQERAPLDDGLQPPALHAAHFGFALAPFALSPDPDMMLWSPGFRRALSVLDYGHASGARSCVGRVLQCS